MSLATHIVSSCWSPHSMLWPRTFSVSTRSPLAQRALRHPLHSRTSPGRRLHNGSCRLHRPCRLHTPRLSGQPSETPSRKLVKHRRPTSSAPTSFHFRFTLGMQFAVVRWHLCRRSRNKLMHSLHGNTSSSDDHHRKTAHGAAVKPLSLACLNVGGFHNSTKWLSLRNHPADLHVLSETQLQCHLHTTVQSEFSAYHVLLSHGSGPEALYWCCRAGASFTVLGC